MPARFALALALASILIGCGGAAPRAEPGADGASAGSSSSSGGDNEPRIALRVHAAPGARYTTRSEGTTVSEGVTIRSESLGDMLVESVDPAARTAVLVTSVQSIRLTDASGRPMEDAAQGLDLTGVTFRRSIDERGAVVGRVEAQGAGEANAAFAETMRATFEQAFIKLPEQPVRVGDTWSDTVTLSVPVQGLSLSMSCRITYLMEGTEGTGESLAAHLAFDTTCRTPETDLGQGSMQITSTSTGSQVVAVRDGLSGTLDLSTETTTTLRLPAAPQPIVIATTQRQRTTTAPLAR
jgi:hypothetical protein